MKKGISKLNDNINESRPTTARSVASDNGSRISLRSLVPKNKISPIVADIVYGTGESDQIGGSRSVPKPIEQKKDEDIIESNGFLKKMLHKLQKNWVSRTAYDVKKNPELFFKSKLRQMFTYFFFLILLLIIVFGMIDANTYFFTVAVKDNVLKYKFADNSGSFGTIQSINDFWMYLESPLMSSLYWNTWYNQIPNTTATEKNLIYYDDILVGLPRMRMVKIKQDTCQVISTFKSMISSCYDIYSDSVVDKTSFGPSNDSSWIYSPPQNDSSFSYGGQLGSYGSGGFIQLLARDLATSLSSIQYLKQNQWINRNSRAVFIDYTLYNSNIDLFSVVKLVVEFSPTGGAFSTYQIRTTKLLRYVTSFDYFVMCCEFIFFVFLIYYIIEEFIEMKKHRMRYFVELWNLIDIFVLIISFSCLLMNVYRCILANSKLNNLLANDNSYPNFDFAAYWQKVYNQAISINIFLSWLKIFKYISFNKRMTQLNDTLSAAMNDLLGFCVMFCIIFLAFSQLAYLLFSSQIEDYKNFMDAGFAVFRIILNDYTFYDFYNVHRILGPLFFVTYIFFVFFVLLNMFVAIIYESYTEVKESLKKLKDDFHIAHFLKQQILGRLKKDRITKIQEVLEKGSMMQVEELSFHDWRRELLLHGYADVEIQALFLKYDQDGDRVLDYDERNKMLQDIKDRKLNTLEVNENEETSSNKEENDFVTEEQMNDLKARINAVEGGLFDIVSKIDRVLEFLADSEQAKLDHQKNVRSSLNFLKDSRSSL